MTMTPRSYQLIEKYLEKNISERESQELIALLESKEDQQEFAEQIRLSLMLEAKYSSKEKSREMAKKILSQRKKNLFFFVMKIAALLVFAIGIGSFFIVWEEPNEPVAKIALQERIVENKPLGINAVKPLISDGLTLTKRRTHEKEEQNELIGDKSTQVLMAVAKDVDDLVIVGKSVSSEVLVANSSIPNHRISSGSRVSLMKGKQELNFADVQEANNHQNERYSTIIDNTFTSTSEKPLSTFSIDVDTASYTNVRRMLNQGQLPPKDAVRIEEFINYFDYTYDTPKGESPFSVHMEVNPCPWNQNNQLLHIGLKGKVDENRPPLNLVFLLDVSGSMNSNDKLPLLKKGFQLLLDSLNERDRVAIVAYAGYTGVVLNSTSVKEKHKIITAMNHLRAGGSTNGSGGIQLAYQLAKENFIQDGANRVVLATDGDFNVGVNRVDELVEFIEKKRETGVFLSVLGFGKGNIRDDVMEKLADHGNGNYHYIDSILEAKKALVQEMSSNMVTIAKDVKIQVVFNSEKVSQYRLIGYVNRKMKDKDFDNDQKDAGEIGMGHTVTALYEMIPVGESSAESWLNLRLRYKQPDENSSKLLEVPLAASPERTQVSQYSNLFNWSAVVASFAMLLRESKDIGDWNYEQAIDLASRSKGKDHEGLRAEMIRLMKKAALMERGSQKQSYPQWEYRK